MTIMDLVSTRDKVRNNQEELKKLANELTEAVQKASSKKSSGSDKSLEDLRSKVYKFVQVTEASRKMLSDYEYLLRTVMEKSEIEWPPRCGQEKQTNKECQ